MAPLVSMVLRSCANAAPGDLSRPESATGEYEKRESQLGQDFSTGERWPGQLGLDRVGAQTVRRSAAARSDATIDAQTGIYAVETESDPRRENDAAA